MGRKPKSDKGKSKCQRQDEQWHREGNFAPVRNFRFMVRNSLLVFFHVSAPSFLLILICNVEFDSNSSWFDRFNKFGINSLQKLKISHKMRLVE